MAYAGRSLTEPDGLVHSALTQISTASMSPVVIRSRRTRGVLPTRGMAVRASWIDVEDVSEVAVIPSSWNKSGQRTETGGPRPHVPRDRAGAGRRRGWPVGALGRSR